MTKQRWILVLGFLAALAVAVTLFVMMNKSSGTSDDVKVTSYDECVDAGFPVMESDPPQCKTDDGQTFTGPALANPTPTPEPTSDPGDGPETLEFTSDKGVIATINDTFGGEAVPSPFTIRGHVPGSWSFEASFEVEVVDANGKSLGTTAATIDGDWMTEDLVPFEATVAYKESSTPTGFIILHKANPADESQFADRIEIPINFNF